MPSDAVVVRFATGRTEYRLTSKIPNVGDTVEREGREWKVADVEVIHDGPVVVTVRLADGDSPNGSQESAGESL